MGQVKGHTRKNKSGKVSSVRSYITKKSKKRYMERKEMLKHFGEDENTLINRRGYHEDVKANIAHSGNNGYYKQVNKNSRLNAKLAATPHLDSERIKKSIQRNKNKRK